MAVISCKDGKQPHSARLKGHTKPLHSMEKQPAQGNNGVAKVKAILEEKFGRQFDSDDLKMLLQMFIRWLTDTQQAERFGLRPGVRILNGWLFFLQDEVVFRKFLDHVAFLDEEGNYGGPQGEALKQYEQRRRKYKDTDNTKNGKK